MISDEALPKSASFLKASGYEEGQKLNLIMVEAPAITKVGTYAVKVEGDAEGLFSLNKTALGAMVEVLGRDELAWIGAKFTALRTTGRNPKTNSEVPTFKVLNSSIKAK